MIKYKTYICTTSRSFISYFISTQDIIMLKVDVFFLSLPREPIFYSTLEYKDFVNPTGWVSWNCCLTWCWGYMYRFLDEMDMWSLVEKNPKETGVLEKHNTKVNLWELKRMVKNHSFLNRNSEHIVGYLIHLIINKTKWKRKTTQH
jgi:hypothetical protein